MTVFVLGIFNQNGFYDRTSTNKHAGVGNKVRISMFAMLHLLEALTEVNSKNHSSVFGTIRDLPRSHSSNHAARQDFLQRNECLIYGLKEACQPQ